MLQGGGSVLPVSPFFWFCDLRQSPELAGLQLWQSRHVSSFEVFHEKSSGYS